MQGYEFELNFTVFVLTYDLYKFRLLKISLVLYNNAKRLVTKNCMANIIYP